MRYRDDADDAALNVGLRRACEEALAGVWFRLRVKSPHCNICSLRFRFVLPDDDELQVIFRILFPYAANCIYIFAIFNVIANF